MSYTGTLCMPTQGGRTAFHNEAIVQPTGDLSWPIFTMPTAIP